MAPPPAYPFEPKSNAYLKPGQFWGVPLSNGRWACGRILARKTESDDHNQGDSRTFLAALMDWHGDERPDSTSIAGHAVVAQGWAHVRSIRLNGQFILGPHDVLQLPADPRSDPKPSGTGPLVLMGGGARPQEVASLLASRSVTAIFAASPSPSTKSGTIAAWEALGVHVLDSGCDDRSSADNPAVVARL